MDQKCLTLEFNDIYQQGNNWNYSVAHIVAVGNIVQLEYVTMMNSGELIRADYNGSVPFLPWSFAMANLLSDR